MPSAEEQTQEEMHLDLQVLQVRSTTCCLQASLASQKGLQAKASTSDSIYEDL